MEVRRILLSVIHKWWLIILLAAVGGAIGYYQYFLTAQTLYSANTTLYALNKDKIASGQTISTQDLSVSQGVVRQYSGIFYSRSVAEAAAKRITDFNVSGAELASMVTISSAEDSTVLTVRAEASDPKIAAAAANAMADEFISQIRTITNSDFIGILDPAQPPDNPIPNNGLKKTLLYFLGGIVVALGIIYVIEYFNTSVRSAEDIEEGLNLRVVGIIPEHDIR
ncbi:lipopolysaccharide biosynthesis [Dehalobacter sp. UNSWDHB]|uniref:YveK family protein n=1 Tax=Dehalobacter sp. UNSWDHB TaxID=1339256 RepID=UPI00038795B0|nr:Wzz/FepE/Etk N-terminal domain-containing protein [Dehalobacter sp. UNSWDHB]EQB22193.1 lipopolysaccharide biosynthesis [Dehalobacter sp. UNSWDHB]